MTRMSKKARRRAISPRRPKIEGPKTGSKKDNLPNGCHPQPNAAPSELSSSMFIRKVP